MKVKTRIHLSLSESTAERLNDLKRQLGSSDVVVGRALALLTTYIDARERGFEMILRKKDDDCESRSPEREILFID